MKTMRSLTARMHSCQIDGRAALLIHDADLERVFGSSLEQLLDAAEQHGR